MGQASTSVVGSFGEGVYKIGQTRRPEPQDRVDELGGASVPFDFDVHALIESENAPALEHKLHKQLLALQVNKINSRKEFFRVSLTDIHQEIEKLNEGEDFTLKTWTEKALDKLTFPVLSNLEDEDSDNQLPGLIA